MAKPEIVILNMTDAFEKFNRDVRPLVANHKTIVGTSSDILQCAMEHLLDNCEHWDRALQSICKNAMGVVDQFLPKHRSNSETRLMVYESICVLGFALKQKAEQHNLEEFDEFYYSVDSFQPNGLVVLKQWWSSHDRFEPDRPAA